MSFCRITGRSRGLPKPNYFPLLPPISPADAKRFCRITGKSYGLPTHHYIPVLLGVHNSDKSKCRITNNSALGSHHYTAGLILGEKKKHVVIKDYRYVFPVLEGDDEQQRALRDLLERKKFSSEMGEKVEEEKMKFVYTVQERRCSLVFPASLEAAVRDGDVSDVMLSRDCDTVLLRLKQGRNVSVDFKELDDFDDLYEGLGTHEQVIKERERLETEAKKRRKRAAPKLNYAKKIFEDKEMADDEVFLIEQLNKAKQLELRRSKEHANEEATHWKNVKLDDIIGKSGERQLTIVNENHESFIDPIIKTCNWTDIQSNIGTIDATPIVTELPSAISIPPEVIDLEAGEIGVVTLPISQETGGFETVSIIKPLTPLEVEINPIIQRLLLNLPPEKLDETTGVRERLLIAGEQALEELPRVKEIPEIVRNVQNGSKQQVHKIKGLKVDIESAQRFVAGQTLETPSGSVFVPGETLQTPQGPTFVPGFTVHTPEGPLLIPGQIVTISENGGQIPVFIAGQTLETKGGWRFVQGQTIHMNERGRFVPGQTILTEEGPKFVAGQIAIGGNRFVPGQTVLTDSGGIFTPGQTIAQNREHIFIPGQSAKINDKWQFISGQCLLTSNGEHIFTPGRTMKTSGGMQFVTGQNLTTNKQTEQVNFIPGITVDTPHGKTFIPGTTLETPVGKKFVEGMIVNTKAKGERFVAGRAISGPSGFEFAAAKSVADITFLKPGPIGLAVNSKTASVFSLLHQEEIYGHMIQTENGVEFIPETLGKSPKGTRIVPGQLVRGEKEGPRFVPGVMTEEGFLPGQTVLTEKGEQFVPGQVVETSSGPKFVPGRMVNTRSGPKFVPGQTVETVEGPRFLPGQIVQTKVGPTFIPGQVISIEDKGSRFVPGQVIDTPDGPRFVPGCVVESGILGVTFVPGQMVQTEEGPRFVAPDLTDTAEGEMEFSVQGFEVTPEELGLLRLSQSHCNGAEQSGEPSIDARLLRQLSEAGMSIGRKISANVPSVGVDGDTTAMVLENALTIVENLGLLGDSAVKMAQIVSTVSQLAYSIIKQYYNGEKLNLENVCNGRAFMVTNGQTHHDHEHINWMNEAIKTAIAAAVLAIADDPRENGEGKPDNNILSSISEAFMVALGKNSISIDEAVNQALKILLIPHNRKSLSESTIFQLFKLRNNKIDILKSTVVEHSLKDDVVLERLSAVLEEEQGNEVLGSAFRKVSEGNPELVSSVLKKVSQEVAALSSEKEAAESVHKAIVDAVRESSELQVRKLLDDKGIHVRELILQAVGLARALGMSSTATSLLNVISDEKSTRALAGDKVTLDILKRLTVMRKLAETRPQFVAALRNLSSDPELAKTDPQLRTLVRESAALMIVPEGIPLQSSGDIPTALLHAENSLAIEDFFIRRNQKPSTIFMILKKGFQTVVPRDASRAVLTGQVAYTVLDENGISHFEPLHVFSALKLNKPSAHRFSMYAIPVAGEEDYEGETSLTTSFTSTNARESSAGIHFTDRTLENWLSRENTPSLRRRSSGNPEGAYQNGKSDNFVVVKDYVSETDNDFSVTVGDIVEAVDIQDDLTKRSRMDPDLEIGKVEACLDSSAARHKLSVRPRRRHTDLRARGVVRSISDSNIQRARVRKIDGKEGWLPMSILMQTALSEDSSTLSQHRPEDSQYRREAVVKELVETEEEFGKDLQQVVERYLKPLDNPGVPRAIRDNKEIIFSNLKHIADFHNTVLIEGVKYYADQPRMLGKTFLRLERDFDKHVAYCRDEPAAQEFLQINNEVREYFEELSQTLGDDKSVSEHLKLPIQRINDYQLLLKELVKYSTRLGENSDDLQKALELMLGIPHQATDNKFISNIEGFKGNIHKLGRLLTHEWFTVTDKDGKTKERYLFLFKARILVCKVRRILEDRSVFVLKDIIKLPEVELKDYPVEQRTFELHNPEISGYPITLVAHKDTVKKTWLKEIREYASDLVALAEHAADDLQLTEGKTNDETKTPTGLNPPPKDKSQTKVQVTAAEKTESCTFEASRASKASIEDNKEMSGRYSATSRFSTSSKVIEEYSSVSSSRNGASSLVETSMSGSLSEKRSSSLYDASDVHSSVKHRTAVSGSSEDTRIAKLALTATDTGRLKFGRTIEGISAQPIRAKQAVMHVIAGESATFECTLDSSSSASKFLWLKDNKPLDDKLADRINIISTDNVFKLKILNVMESDTGIYTARAANGDCNASCTAQLIVENLTADERRAQAEAKAPVFLVQLKNTELLENTYLRFMIKVKGDPNPELKFFKDGILIDSKSQQIKIITERADSGFYELVIPDVQKADAGMYSCVATNKFGECLCEAEVTVTDEKSLFAGLPEGIFEPGAEPSFKWLRDGKPFDPEERFKVLFEDKEDTLALVFQHVKPEDAGLYTCVAQTSTGNISCSAELTVQGNVNQLLKEPTKPVLDNESRTSEVNVGGSAMLDLQVKGFPKPQITWSKDGKEIVAGGRIKYLWEDEESLSLVIKNVTCDDGGVYTIKAKNELGEDTTYIELIVKSAPKIIKKMADTFAYIETDAKMTVQIQASPPPNVTWYKDGQVIKESERISFVKEGNDSYSLIIMECRLTDTGSYSVMAKNEINQTSDVWNFDVKCPPKIKKKLGENRIIEDGASLTLQIEVETTSESDVIWMKDEVVIRADERVIIEAREEGIRTLSINGTVGTDAGIYKAQVSNKDGTTVDQVGIEVKCGPRFKKNMTDVITKVGAASAEFSVEVAGYPRPKVQWYIGKSEITEEKKDYTTSSEGDVHKLIVNDIKEERSGTFICKLTNEYGSDSSSGKLIVYCKPKIVKKMVDQKLNEGDTLKLAVQISGTPDPDIKWFKDGKEVSADARIKITRDSQRKESYDLTLNLLKGSDGGTYEVRAENEMGSVVCKSKVIVLTKTEATADSLGDDSMKKVGVDEDILIEKPDSEGPEGCEKLVKRSIEKIKGKEGETITISMESTTEHEATMTGPDERHTISKMKSTKVECQEIHTDLPQVEEIASYNYTIHDDKNIHKPPNGILIEEYSDGEENRKKHSVNRGVSIVSVSDDESTLKALSRDVSAEEMFDADVSEGLGRGESLQGLIPQGKSVEEKVFEYDGPHHAVRYTETIIEETFIENSSQNPLEAVSLETIPLRGSADETKLTKQCAKIERVDSIESRKASITDISRRNSQTAVIEDEKMSHQSSRKGSIVDHSRRNSQRAVIDHDDDDDLDVDEKTKSLLERIKRERSVLDEIIDQTTEKKDNGEIGAAPQIVSHDFEDRTIYETQSTVFTIKATGLPRPDAKWFKDGKPLKSADKGKPAQTGETYTLTFNKATEKETGIYQLVLTNKLGSISLDAFLEVGPVGDLRKPRFCESVKDVDVEIHTTGTLQGVLTAEPIPEIVWLQDGQEIALDDKKFTREVATRKVEDGLHQCTFSLIIKDCLPSDVAKYTLKATNMHGEASSIADLELLAPPQILEFKDLNAAVEELSVWEVIIKSNPKAELSWERENVLLMEDDSRYGSDDDYKNKKYRLILKNVVYEDAGTYRVIAKNYLGEDSAEAQLLPFTVPPEIIKTLSNGAVRHDAAIEFKVEATGIARPKIQWFINGDELANDGRHTIITTIDDHVFSTLSIVNFDATDEGELVCVATNLAGKAKTNCTLSMIRIPPTFDKLLPKSKQIEQGEPLELSIDIDGSPFPRVTWFKDGEKIVPDGHVRIETQPNGSTKLTIDHCIPTDCGAYKLIAKNNNGENMTQCAVAVKPTQRRPSFSKPLEDIHIMVGESMKLQAQVVAFPTPEVQWFKDSLPLRKSQDIEFVNEPNGIMGLSIESAKPEDTGVYSLLVKNDLGEVTGTAHVEVEAKEKKPGFLITLQPLTVVEGFPAKLEVTTVGKPSPLLKWMHNGVDIVPDGVHIKVISQPDGTHALVIDKVKCEDAGEYGVLASNSQGEEASYGILSVVTKEKTDIPEEKPGFLGQLRDVTVEEGETLALSASFSANPLPDVSWTKDGEPVEPKDSRVLLSCDGKKVGIEIHPCSPKDAGVYRCRLINPLGEDASSGVAIVRKIYSRPNFAQRFTDLQQLTGCDAKFAARITGIPRPDVTWYFNDKTIGRDSDKYKMKRDGDICCLYVSDCSSLDVGKYKCRAVNKEGEACCEAGLSLGSGIDSRQKVEAPSFLKRIGDCEIYKGMTAKFTACVTGCPEPSFEWYRNNERLWPTDRIRMEEEGSGLLRLILINIDEHDVGKYSLRIYNPHGEDICHAEMRYDTLDIRPKKTLADQYSEFDKYRKSGIPLPLADRPIISRMMDRHLTLSWKPSIPIGPRVPVTYLVEMCELPDGDWFTAKSGLRSCVCDIRNLEPFRDYKYRIRVENKYGISDPSPFAQTYRSKLMPDPPKFHPYLSPGIDFRPETSPYFPKDFDIERPPHDGYAQAPKFLRQEHDAQYGVKNHNCNLFWFVYGYPKPKMSYYFNNELIECGGRYDHSYTRNGQATLFINKMLERDAGIYEAVAINEHGEARQRVRLLIAEYPTFVKRPEESIIMLRRNGHLQARILGTPYPEIKWYKDWKPLAPTARLKMDFFEPDMSVLTINDAILKDEGLYSISARNIAGSVSCSVMVHVEENEHEYGYRTYTRQTDVKPKIKLFDDYYDLGDELGRGTQGITYHAVERATGKTYGAKVMHGRGELKPLMLNEVNAMNHLNHRNLLRLHDAYETDGSMTLLTELAGGGELVDTLTRNPFYTEWEVANYIRQILKGLDHMHNESWAHLGLTLGDLLISHSGSDELKIADFGLARRISYNKLMMLVYGMPEFVAPEVINGDGVTYSADMWSLGIITHILLSGISPFRGINDRETLTKIKGGNWDFDERWWIHISSEAKDFVKRLLVYTVEGRMDVAEALRHPWLRGLDKSPVEPYKIPSENLRNYYKLFRDWYSNASCRNWYRRRRLSSAFEHPSKMVYPPGDRYTPEPMAERTFTPREKPEPNAWENRVPSRESIDTKIGMFSNESHYQNGPDTYLLQLRDTDFPVRLREYMKVAHDRCPSFTRIYNDEGYDWRTPIIRERRRFTDVMDEEIDDERKARINNYGADSNTMRRLRHELGTRLDSYYEADAMIEEKKGGNLPFFREKPQILQIQAGKCAQLVCYAVGNPKPNVQWYKNDLVIQEGKRINIVETTDGRSILSFSPTREYDIGIYKVVARNPVGQTVARTRIVLATVPGISQAPQTCGISDTEILLRWKAPKDDGNSEILCYNLQYKAGDSIDWIDAASNIDHEFYLVKDLQPNTSYHFRLSARNRIGWGDKGFETNLIQTKPEGTPKVSISRAMQHLQHLTESGQEIIPDEEKPRMSYEAEECPIEWTIDSQFTTRYSFISEVSRGRFSMIVKGAEKESDRLVVAKILEVRPELKEAVGEEFQVLRSLRHERIALLEAAYWPANSPIAVFILEKLQGSDVLTYLASRPEYTENCVATIITEVLDALQYLHWRGYCHLDIQPDNIVMASLRSAHVKIVDFGTARKVSKLGTEVPLKCGHHEYRSPEVLNEELAYPQTDIWSVAVLAYVLLSGVSPFKGADDNETRQNISFVRYRFEHLFKEISQEATRFLMLLFKRTPSKRPTAEECHEHRWLMPTEFMIKKRERTSFSGDRLKKYNEEYHEMKRNFVSKSDNLTQAFGSLRNLHRSHSTEDELITSIDIE
ncbi:muscle M-line assembly protein unc-89 isoform X2 [Fopius arisanus]|uniref:Muscle M-line assembly protein unc-89 isoform X2 n=1 Tax=Fopius arisanus TaxID=64838 RepID=A0A9R1T988_9HYME|nr:PREDICTED: muscle M-line assembly protein unc-89 isoform X2 [Fopius arisanus]